MRLALFQTFSSPVLCAGGCPVVFVRRSKTDRAGLVLAAKACVRLALAEMSLRFGRSLQPCFAALED
ncbi:hypothetical protein DZC30_13475 [Comamonas testosteroni]|uniref:Uncharacterized protein n=1 Tax=Comamonas testosteroni TaxID=285 RepID=A0A373FIV5_COMTE|nr:hypothetical protein DZC30_13475 [Comamonas testosteroni]